MLCVCPSSAHRHPVLSCCCALPHLEFNYNQSMQQFSTQLGETTPLKGDALRSGDLQDPPLTASIPACLRKRDLWWPPALVCQCPDPRHLPDRRTSQTGELDLHLWKVSCCRSLSLQTKFLVLPRGLGSHPDSDSLGSQRTAPLCLDKGHHLTHLHSRHRGQRWFFLAAQAVFDVPMENWER